MAEGRICSKCGVYKDREFFGTHKGKCRSQCKVCEKEYYEANRESILARQKAHYEAHPGKKSEIGKKTYEKNKDKVLARQSARYWENPEKKLEYSRQHYQDNKEEYKARHQKYNEENKDYLFYKAKLHKQANREHYNKYMVEWGKKNPEKKKAIIHRRRAKVKGAEGYFTADDVKAMYAEQEGKCFYCNCDISEYYEVEHQIPISRGGSNWPENLKLTCRSCNASKNDKTHEEFLEHRKIQEKFYLHDLLLHWR